MAPRVAVLASGRGSNLQALIDAARGGAPFEIALVVTDRADAFALERAKQSDLPARLVDRRRFAERRALEREIERVLDDADIAWVALAGFMRVLTAAFIATRPDRIVNIHPSLLPAFRGLHTHRRALETGVRITGCTVHVVRPALDDGPIIAQAAVPVLADDDETTLAARVLEREHQIYPLALGLMTSGAGVVDGEQVRLVKPVAEPPQGFIWPKLA